MTSVEEIASLLGDEAQTLLEHECEKVPRARLKLPSPSFVDEVWLASDRRPRVLRNLQTLFSHGRLAHTGYLSVLPVDQGVEHSAGASFAKNPSYFDPEAILTLAIEGGCSAVASSFGVLSLTARKYAHHIPFIAKFNHNELLSYPNKAEQITWGSVRHAWELGCVAVGATVYFGSADAAREIVEVSRMFEQAHELGMATILWCYLRNDSFKMPTGDYHFAADLSGQANYLGATLGADLVKQKLPTTNGGYLALSTPESSYGKLDQRIYDELSSEHPIDLCRYQVLNGFAGRVALISSGGASADSDFSDAVRAAVINKRAGGCGMIAGRKAFQRPTADGVRLLNAIQDVYLCPDVSIA